MVRLTNRIITIDTISRQSGRLHIAQIGRQKIADYFGTQPIDSQGPPAADVRFADFPFNAIVKTLEYLTKFPCITLDNEIVMSAVELIVKEEANIIKVVTMSKDAADGTLLKEWCNENLLNHCANVSFSDYGARKDEENSFTVNNKTLQVKGYQNGKFIIENAGAAIKTLTFDCAHIYPAHGLRFMRQFFWLAAQMLKRSIWTTHRRLRLSIWVWTVWLAYKKSLAKNSKKFYYLLYDVANWQFENKSSTWVHQFCVVRIDMQTFLRYLD